MQIESAMLKWRKQISPFGNIIQLTIKCDLVDVCSRTRALVFIVDYLLLHQVVKAVSGLTFICGILDIREPLFTRDALTFKHHLMTRLMNI